MSSLVLSVSSAPVIATHEQLSEFLARQEDAGLKQSVGGVTACVEGNAEPKGFDLEAALVVGQSCSQW
jgi:hypothetical protein